MTVAYDPPTRVCARCGRPAARVVKSAEGLVCAEWCAEERTRKEWRVWLPERR